MSEFKNIEINEYKHVKTITFANKRSYAMLAFVLN